MHLMYISLVGQHKDWGWMSSGIWDIGNRRSASKECGGRGSCKDYWKIRRCDGTAKYRHESVGEQGVRGKYCHVWNGWNIMFGNQYIEFCKILWRFLNEKGQKHPTWVNTDNQ
mmetsp:Transcript_31997/g.55712  ORF Transcript_31997/g.55712 Transcript_31997/m.55712 type:complete len:113 (+) Transcript_31997:1365-1703(+)